MNYQTIITPASLADNLYMPDWLILDCRSGLLSDSEGYNTYIHQHIPNAYYCDSNESNLDSVAANTCGVSSSESAQIITELEVLGYSKDTQVIIYEDLNSSFTDTLWLRLRSLGVPNVAVLQGGFTSWQAQKLPMAIAEQRKQNETGKSVFN